MARFNDDNNELMVTVQNNAKKNLVFIGTYTIEASDGTKQTVGDLNPILIKGSELKTIVYDIEPIYLYNNKLRIKIKSGKSPDSLFKYRWKKLVVTLES